MFTFFIISCFLLFITIVHGQEISEYYANKKIKKLKNKGIN
jgi:hypothetical protein